MAAALFCRVCLGGGASRNAPARAPARLAARLRVLARDRAAYDAHFAWRSPGRDTPAARAAFQKTLDMTAYKYTALCRICAKLDADLA